MTHPRRSRISPSSDAAALGERFDGDDAAATHTAATHTAATHTAATHTAATHTAAAITAAALRSDSTLFPGVNWPLSGATASAAALRSPCGSISGGISGSDGTSWADISRRQPQRLLDSELLLPAVPLAANTVPPAADSGVLPQILNLCGSAAAGSVSTSRQQQQQQSTQTQQWLPRQQLQSPASTAASASTVTSTTTTPPAATNTNTPLPPVMTCSAAAPHQPANLYPPLSTTDSAAAALQIVLYRDRHVVVYNPFTSRLGARQLSPTEETAVQNMWMVRCPVCCQLVDPRRFSFEAQSYFYLLQEFLRRTAPSASHAPTRATSPAPTAAASSSSAPTAPPAASSHLHRQQHFSLSRQLQASTGGASSAPSDVTSAAATDDTLPLWASQHVSPRSTSSGHAAASSSSCEQSSSVVPPLNPFLPLHCRQRRTLLPLRSATGKNSQQEEHLAAAAAESWTATTAAAEGFASSSRAHANSAASASRLSAAAAADSAAVPNARASTSSLPSGTRQFRSKSVVAVDDLGHCVQLRCKRDLMTTTVDNSSRDLRSVPPVAESWTSTTAAGEGVRSAANTSSGSTAESAAAAAVESDLLPRRHPPTTSREDDDVEDVNIRQRVNSSPPLDSVPLTRNIPANLLVTGYYRRFFREIKMLGSGSFGQVYLCHHTLDDLLLGEYAVKKIPVGDDKLWLISMIKEVKIREKLHHPNVVDYKHSWLEMHRSNGFCPYVPWLFVLMEYCNGGDLEQLIWVDPKSRSTSRYLPEAVIWKIFIDVLLGLQHLHHNGILHRDLKLSNILLQCGIDEITGTSTAQALLADFGTAETINCCRRSRASAFTVLPPIGERRRGFTGTVEYTAPELLMTDDEGAYLDDYDVKSDMWSLGIILYALAFASLPYSDPDPQQCRVKILGHSNVILPNTPERTSDLQLLIEALLATDPNKRPSTDDLTAHPLIRQLIAGRELLSTASADIATLLLSLDDPTAAVSATAVAAVPGRRAAGRSLRYSAEEFGNLAQNAVWPSER